MKKNIFFAAIACACLTGLTSCDSWLDEEVRSSMTSNDYDKTEAQIQQQVTRLYRSGAPSELTGAGSAYVGPKCTLPGMLTGYFMNEYEGQELTCQYARELTRQGHTNTVGDSYEGFYSDCYSAINTANSVIKYAPEIVKTESTQKELIAEAKFFRAFNFFTLVKTFGDVPMPTTPYEEAVNMELAKSPAADVYKLIEDDLKDAVANLPAKKFYDNGNKVGKYAAAMLLTSVYMQEGKYSDAKESVKTVLNSGHSLTQNDDFGANSAFNKLRSTDGLDEVIYAYEYNSTIETSSWWPSYAFDQSAVVVSKKYSIYTNIYQVSDSYLKVYPAKDLRIQPNQFFHWSYNYTTKNDKGEDVTKTWTPVGGKAANWYFYDEQAITSTGQGSKDFNFFRYSEALLDAAEAIAQTDGVTADAKKYLAEVQLRSNTEGKTLAEIEAALPTSKEKFIEACWTERLREFPLEFKIWDDCLRTKKFPEIKNDGTVNYVNLVGATNGSGAQFKQTDLVWPFPLNELQRNKLLVQNDGYAKN